MSRDFGEFSYGQLQGCVLEIDGRVVKTRKPYQNEGANSSAYFTRHGCYGLVVLATLQI